MSRLKWGETSRTQDSGVDRGVLYLNNKVGTAWSGLISVNEKANSTISSLVYFDGYRRILQEVSEFSATIEAFTYPDEFESFTGDEAFYAATQPRPRFDFSYRTLREPDYLIHLVYNAMVTPAPRTLRSIREIPSPSSFVWELETTAAYVHNAKPSSHILVDTADSRPAAVSALEDILYGTAETIARMPSVDELFLLFDVQAIMTIVDNGDGTWTATGPDEMIRMTDPDAFEITQPDAAYIHEDVYTIATH